MARYVILLLAIILGLGLCGSLSAASPHIGPTMDPLTGIYWATLDLGRSVVLTATLEAPSEPENGTCMAGFAARKTSAVKDDIPDGSVVYISIRAVSSGQCEMVLDATDGVAHSRCTLIKIPSGKSYEVRLTVLPCEGRFVAHGEYRVVGTEDWVPIIDSSESPSSPGGVWHSGKTYVCAPAEFAPNYSCASRWELRPVTATSEKCLVPSRKFARRDINKHPFTVVEYSWTTVDTKYYHDNLRQVERAPFDGRSVFIADPRLPHGSVLSGAGRGDFGWEVFQNKKLGWEVVAPAIEDMKTAKSKSLRSNYLVCTSFLPGGYMNWFDDQWWANIANNARLLGTAAKRGGFEGIMFDPEEYGCDFWAHQPLLTKPEYAGKSYEEVRDKVRQRGREFARALNAGYPGIRIWSLLAWDQIYTFRTKNKAELKDAWGTLTIPFLDGILEGSDDKTIIIDGIEGGYYLNALPDFVARAKNVKEKGIGLSDVPELFKKKVRTGFGIYLDRNQKWDPVNIQDNYWTPKRLEDVIYYALIASDGFVWLWNERPTWLISSVDEKLGGGTDFGAPSRNEIIKPVPKVYWQSLAKAKVRATKWLKGK